MTKITLYRLNSSLYQKEQSVTTTKTYLNKLGIKTNYLGNKIKDNDILDAKIFDALKNSIEMDELKKKYNLDLSAKREKAYIINYGSYFKISDKIECADWLYNYIKRKYTICTLNKQETEDVIKKFQKRYELDYFNDAERIMKGFNLDKEVLSKYHYSFDTNMGMYNLSIEKKNSNLSVNYTIGFLMF